MWIALDAMGGDYAPDAVVEGAVDAAHELGIQVLLLGQEQIVRQKLGKRGDGLPIEVVHAPEVM